MRPLYFDYNATTPILPRVFRAMAPCLSEHFGNPGSGHIWGLSAKTAMDQARTRVSGLINCLPEEIVFTSGATEANNLALFGLLSPGDHVVSSTIEHPAVLEPLRVFKERGGVVTLVQVDGNGLVSAEDVIKAVTPRTRLVSIMLANNEVGTVQPVAEIAYLVRSRGVPVHTDASQAVGKMPVDVQALGVDLLSIAGHKLYAPKGVGALFVRRGARLRPVVFGGGQEQGLRPGTENIPHIVGLGEACSLAEEDLTREKARLESLGERFSLGLENLKADYRIHGHGSTRLPNTCSVGFKGLRAGDILSGLVGMEIGASAGAACHGDTESISHVLEAMGVPRSYALGTIRFSWGRPTSLDDVDELMERLAGVLAGLAS